MVPPGAHEELLPILHRALKNAVVGTGEDPGLLNGGGLGIRHIAAGSFSLGSMSSTWLKSVDIVAFLMWSPQQKARGEAAATTWIGLGFPASAGWVKSGDGPWPSGATASSTINDKEMAPQPASGVGLEEHGQGALSGKPH